MRYELNWHFTTYPAVGIDDIDGTTFHWSDDVLVKCTNGDICLACYCEEKDEWYCPDTMEWFSTNTVCCWASYGRVPDTLDPMPRRGKR